MPQRSLEERAAEGTRFDEKLLRDAIRESREAPLPILRAQSFVNYAAAPAGGAVYDSNWLASNTTAR
jgi:hypothetical protein